MLRFMARSILKDKGTGYILYRSPWIAYRSSDCRPVALGRLRVLARTGTTIKFDEKKHTVFFQVRDTWGQS